MGNFRAGLSVSGGIAAGMNCTGLLFCAVLFLFFAQATISQTQNGPFFEKESFSIDDSVGSDRFIAARFNSDGTKLLLVRRKTADVYSTETGKKISSFDSTTDFLDDGYEFHWQPNGSRILQFGRRFSKKAVAKLWDSDSGKLIASLEETRGVQYAEWNSQGDRLLTVGGSSSGSGSASFLSNLSYSIRDQHGKALRTERMPTRDIHYLAFSSSRNKLIGSFNLKKDQKPIRIFDIDSGEMESSYDHGLTNVSSWTYAIFAGESPDGKYLCGQIDLSKGVTCWRTEDDSKPIYSFLDNKETGDIHFAGFSPDSKRFAIIKAKPRSLEIIDVESGKPLAVFKSSNKLDRLHFAAGTRGFIKEQSRYGEFWSYDGKYFVLSDVEKEVTLWDVGTGKLISRREAVWNTSYDWFVGTIPVDYEVFSFSCSNGLLLSRSVRNVRVFDPSDGKVIFEVKETARKPEDRSVHRYISSWSPDGNSILTAADRNRTVILWTLRK